MISRRSYDWRRLITSIIRRFSRVVFNFIKQSYNDLKSIQRTRRTVIESIFDMIVLSTASMSNSWVMTYNFAIRTKRVTCLHLIDDQWMTFALFVAFARQMTYSICDEKSLLLTKETSVNIISWRLLESSLTYFNFLMRFFICHCRRLFNSDISFEIDSTVYATWDRSKDASSWQTKTR
jgi:hypothetical protein